MTITREQLLREIDAAVDRSGVCSFESCTRPRAAHGLCASHDQQRRRGVPLAPLKPYGKAGRCAVCGRRAVTRGWCSAHYLRWLRFGDPQPEKPLRTYRRRT